MNDRHLYVLMRKPDARGKIEKSTSNDLYCAARIPLAELGSSEPDKIAKFLIADSYTPAWAHRQRRPIGPGDGFWLRGVAYLFVTLVDSDKFVLHLTRKIELRKVLST